jgi:hypothetical protein
MILEKTKKLAPVGRFPAVTHPASVNVNPTWHAENLGSVLVPKTSVIHASYFFPTVRLGSGSGSH